MKVFGYDIAAKFVAMFVAGLLIVGLVLITLSQCDKRRSQAAQARVERSQAEAASKSAADAINAVTGVGANQAASEELGRTNDRDIRSAPGASDRVNSGVDLAGRKALCKRKAYVDDPKCAPFRRQ